MINATMPTTAAEAIVDRVLAAQPRNSDALLQKGTLLLQRGEVDGAEDAYRKTIAVAPKYTDAYLGLSQVYLRRREPSNAALALTWIPEDAVRGPEVTAQEGRVLRAQGHFLKARKKFDEARAAQPENTDYTEAKRDTPILFNTTSVESEQFRRSGQTTVLNNTLTFRPDRLLSVDVIGEQWWRSGGRDGATRGGVAVAVSPVPNVVVRGQALESTDRESVPSRFDLDADIRVLPHPGTHILAGVTKYLGDPLDTDSHNLGIRQYLTDRVFVQAQRFWAKDDGPGAEGGETDVVRVGYLEERVRHLTLGYATGNEAFRVDNVGLATGSYDLESVFVSGKQWIGKNYGVLGGIAITDRTNGNDSKTYSAGLFFEF